MGDRCRVCTGPAGGTSVVNVMDEREFEAQADMLRLMANAKRLMIIKVLGGEEKTVGEIASEVGITLQNASQHLRLMRDGGLVEHRRAGQTIYYGLSTQTLAECCERVRRELYEIQRQRGSMLAGAEEMQKGREDRPGKDGEPA